MAKRLMGNYRAVALAEGFEEGTEEEVIEAWQYLVDTGYAIEIDDTRAIEIIENNLERLSKVMRQARRHLRKLAGS